MNHRQNYLDMQKRHQQELSDFPIAYAFSDKQLEEALDKLGAKKEECVTVFGHGDIVKKSDAKTLLAMLERHTKETQEALKDPDFAEAAFLYEMDNHEYAINWSGDEDVLACFGFKWKDIEALGLQMAWYRARDKHFENAREWDMI